MEGLVKLIVDNGISIICVAYLIYFQSTTMKKMQEILSLIEQRLAKIETKLDTDIFPDRCHQFLLCLTGEHIIFLQL